MNLNDDKEKIVARRLFARVYSDVVTTSEKSGISELILTEYISKMLGYCCIDTEDEEEDM